MFKALTANRLSFILAAIICIVLVVINQSSGQYQPVNIICFIFASITCWMNFSRLRKISDAPISTIAAAAQGYIELHGRASTQEPLKTPYLDIPCVWYKSAAYDDSVGSGNTNDHNKGLLELLVSDHMFQLQDRSGICLVNPKGAEILHVHKKTGRRHNHKYVEEYIPFNSLVYVIGHLDTRHDYLVPKLINQDVTKKLSDWKSNAQKLLAKYDLDRNGELSLQEWELARKDARHEVIAEHKRKASNNTYLLSKPKNKQLFLISALSPRDLLTNFQLWSFIHFCLAITFLFKLI